MKKVSIIKTKIKKQKRKLRKNSFIDRHRYLRFKIKKYCKKNILPITFAHFEVEGKKLKKLKSACKYLRLKHFIRVFGNSKKEFEQ